ncbi:hypothetical protein B0H13DRAFT_1907428 [Mycena leptocephala]|nr:hypothetical protein B0H13DRAFT_1907428 [Mycena leptocephala]
MSVIDFIWYARTGADGREASAHTEYIHRRSVAWMILTTSALVRTIGVVGPFGLGISCKRKAPPQMMVGAPGISSVSSQSQNLRRVKTRRSVVPGTVAGPSGAGEPRYYEEDPVTQAARAALDFSWDLGDSSLDAQADNEVDNGIKVVVNPPRNKNSDRPLQTWVPLTDEYCAEALRREGRRSERVVPIAHALASPSIAARMACASGKSCVARLVLLQRTRNYQLISLRNGMGNSSRDLKRDCETWACACNWGTLLVSSVI